MYGLFGEPDVRPMGKLANVSKYCSITKKPYVINVPLEAMIEFKSGSPRLIQDIFPDLSPEDRDFIKLGCTPAEWNETFKDLEE